jgi:hypothetical protein
MIKKLLALDERIGLGLMVAVDVICVGLGMGVPIFCLLFGFPLGIYLARRAAGAQAVVSASDLAAVLRHALARALWVAAATLAMMAVIWYPAARMLFDPAADLANFGLPMILYEPRASFIGWLALMIIISPALQVLTAAFGAYLALAGTYRHPRAGQGAAGG